VLSGAESKDPDGACLAYAAGSFSTTEARRWRTLNGLSLGREQVRTAGRILCCRSRAWPAFLTACSVTNDLAEAEGELQIPRFARDDKKERIAVGKGRLLTEKVVAGARRCPFL
jgi:hypothetical protein